MEIKNQVSGRSSGAGDDPIGEFEGFMRAFRAAHPDWGIIGAILGPLDEDGDCTDEERGTARAYAGAPPAACDKALASIICARTRRAENAGDIFRAVRKLTSVLMRNQAGEATLYMGPPTEDVERRETAPSKEQNRIVPLRENKARIDSRIAAQILKRGHDEILRIVDILSDPVFGFSADFIDDNFWRGAYLDSEGKTQPCYYLGWSGFFAIRRYLETNSSEAKDEGTNSQG